MIKETRREDTNEEKPNTTAIRWNAFELNWEHCLNN